MSTPTTYNYLLTDFPNNKFDIASLQIQVEHSNIVTSLDYGMGIGGNANGGVSISFLDVLSTDDKTILDNIIATHTGVSIVPPTPLFDEDGRMIIAGQPSLIGNGTWIISDNICSTNLPSNDISWTGGVNPASIGTTHANGQKIVYEWIPLPGKRLYTLETELICSADVDLNSVGCHFIGVNCGLLGTTQFDRYYPGEWGRWGYRTQADEVFEDANEKRFRWRYTQNNAPPIILKSMYNSKITLTRAGVMTGTYAYVKIRAISLPE